jgi:hypothetical protein
VIKHFWPSAVDEEERQAMGVYPIAAAALFLLKAKDKIAIARLATRLDQFVF